MHLRLLVSSCVAGLALAACGDNLRPATDDAAVDGPAAICGDGVIGRGEDCDDGDTVADAICTATCRFTCGNGVVDDAVGELCDPGITAGAGACPATCDDGMACTADVRAGEGCQVACEHAAITTPIAGDGCCPTGATSLTDPDCGVVCGNGVLEPGELCDLGIASGAGACPLTCSDGLSCTADALVGAGTCAAMCTATPITAPVDGDGCCPPGATPATDDDCQPTCGNGTLDPGETCDLAITAGPGRCPTVCTDGMVCTTDALANPGTCTAACAFTPITTPRSGDGCCPPGATSATDSDCLPGCGNGVVDPGETCDTAILAGPGRCATSCDDGMVCTTNTLLNGGTCTATCSFPPIVTPAPGDGCCPVGANATTDNDCPAVCGNGVVEPGETCDRTIAVGLPGACPNACSDGLACTRDTLTGPGTCAAACTFTPITTPANGDGCCPPGATPATDSDCVVTPTAFRLRDLDLRDPHVFVNFIGCRDVTDNPLAGFSVNGELQTNIQTDGDVDGDLDLSIATVFRPLDQAAGATPALEEAARDRAEVGAPGGDDRVRVVHAGDAADRHHRDAGLASGCARRTAPGTCGRTTASTPARCRPRHVEHVDAASLSQRATCTASSSVKPGLSASNQSVAERRTNSGLVRRPGRAHGAATSQRIAGAVRERTAVLVGAVVDSGDRKLDSR
jgi:hypothetical protein